MREEGEGDFCAVRRVLLRWGWRDPNPESYGSVRARKAAGTRWWRLGGGQGRVVGWAGSRGWGAWVGGVRVARQRVRARVRGIVWRGV